MKFESGKASPDVPRTQPSRRVGCRGGLRSWRNQEGSYETNRHFDDFFLAVLFPPDGGRQKLKPEQKRKYKVETRASPRCITFDAPGAVSAPDQGTFSAQINNLGLIVGNYVDANGVNHGFVRYPNGSITTFDVPGGGTGPNEGTVPNGITDTGVVVGGFSMSPTYFMASWPPRRPF